MHIAKIIKKFLKGCHTVGYFCIYTSAANTMVSSLTVATCNTGTSSCGPKEGCEFADRIVFSNKVRFPGLKEAVPDFVGVAKITTSEVAAFKPSLSCIDRR